MPKYRYRVTGARGAVYETTTLREAKRMAGKHGVIEDLDPNRKRTLREVAREKRAAAGMRPHPRYRERNPAWGEDREADKRNPPPWEKWGKQVDDEVRRLKDKYIGKVTTDGYVIRDFGKDGGEGGPIVWLTDPEDEGTVWNFWFAVEPTVLEHNPAWWDKTKKVAGKAKRAAAVGWKAGRQAYSGEKTKPAKVAKTKSTGRPRKYQPGSKVKHLNWGEDIGTVLSRDKNMAKVQWSDGSSDWAHTSDLYQISKNPTVHQNPNGPGAISRTLRAMAVSKTIQVGAHRVRRVDADHWVVDATRYKLAEATIHAGAYPCTMPHPVTTLSNGHTPVLSFAAQR